MPRDRRHQLPRPAAALLAAVGVAATMAFLVDACTAYGFTLTPDAAGGWLIAVLFAVYAVAAKPVIRVERGVWRRSRRTRACGPHGRATDG